MSPQLKANLREFGWIANVIYSNQLLVTWHTSQTKTLEDAKQRVTTIGTTGAGSASVQYPPFYNNVLGTKFKIIFGYRSGAEIDLAMERGEVEGRGTNPYSSYMATHPTWIPQNKLNPAGAGRRREGAGAAERAADPRSAGAGRRTSRCCEFMARSVDRRPAAGDDARRARRPGGGVARGLRGGGARTRTSSRRRRRRSSTCGRRSGDKIAEIIFGLLDTPAGRARADESRRCSRRTVHEHRTAAGHEIDGTGIGAKRQ